MTINSESSSEISQSLKSNSVHSLLIHTSSDHSYPVHIGALPHIQHVHKVLLVTNTTIAGLHLPKVLNLIEAPNVYACVLPDGEQYKTMQSIEFILECAFCHKLDRKSLMIALGGGVIGDMVGFASGMYQRGIDFIQIPTTLLAQVDASVGGKTGINNAFGKNLIGLFHQPKAVYIDPVFLHSLPSREFSAGVAEMIKIAVCFDKAFFEFLQANPLRNASDSILCEAIAKSVGLKAHVVQEDEREKGIRAGLNYGHTFGHVIENLTDYKRYLHGEAVSIGMNMANALAYKLGLLSAQEKKNIFDLLRSYDLPISFEIPNVEAFYQQFFLDKKSFDSKIMFVLPDGIGRVSFHENIPQNLVYECLDDFGRGKSPEYI